MNRILAACVLTALFCPQAAAMADDDLLDAEISTETAKAYEAAADEDAQADIQESDEDLAGFVQDYVGRDSSLKGGFFIEDGAAGRILKLSLESVIKKSAEGPDNARVIEAVFKGPGGKKYPVLFYIQSAGFGGIDIFKIALKQAAPKKEENPKRK
jgi:hypothetical protein